MTTFLRTAPTTIADELAARARPTALGSIDRCFEIREYDTEGLGFVPGDRVRQIELHQGELVIDERVIPNARFGRGFVSFSVSDGSVNLSGVLDFTPEAGALSGQMFISSPGGEPAMVQVAGAAPVTTYETRLGTTGATPPPGQTFPTWSPPAPSTWTPSVEVTQTYTFVNGKIPTPIFEIAGQDVTDFAGTATDPTTGNLLVAVDIPDSIISEYIADVGAEAPVSMIIEIAQSGTTFTGAARKAVLSSDGTYAASEQWYAFDGTWNQQPQTGQPTGPPAPTGTVIGSSAAEFSAITSGATLGIGQLYTMQVDPGQLQDAQFNALVENMKWALGQIPDQSLLGFFDELPPDLLDDRVALIKQDLGWYTGTMATSYLAGPINAMQGQSAPTTHMTAEQLTDLQFFLRAGLPKDPAFTRQTQGVFLSAFTQVADGLADYLADQQAHTVNGKIDPAHDWGAQLLSQVTTPTLLNMTYNGVAQGFGLSNFNRHTSLLMALDPGGTYATQYHQAFLSRSLGACIEHLQTSDPAAVATWLELAISAIITNFKDAPASPQIDPDTAQQLRELAEQLDEAADHLGGASALARALADIAVAVKGGKGQRFWDWLRDVETGWQKAGYAFARAIYVIVVVGGLIASIISLFNWDHLTQPQQGEAITAILETVAKIIEAVKEIWSGEWGFAESAQLDNALSDFTNTSPLLSGFSSEELEDACERVAGMADTETGGLDTTGTTWAEYFATFETFDLVMSVIGAAAAVAFAVLSMVTFIEDIIGHASVSTIVLDGIISAANYGVAIAAVVSIISASECVPIVGAIFAVIGVIAALIETLIPKPKPTTPAERFMQGYLVPAIASPWRWILPSPTGWSPGQPIPTTNAYNPGT